MLLLILVIGDNTSKVLFFEVLFLYFENSK